jgi:hypothetical protein
VRCKDGLTRLTSDTKWRSTERGSQASHVQKEVVVNSQGDRDRAFGRELSDLDYLGGGPKEGGVGRKDPHL